VAHARPLGRAEHRPEEGFRSTLPRFRRRAALAIGPTRRRSGEDAEYRSQGARLGWLIDPDEQRVEVYRPGRRVKVLTAPPTLSGEDVLPGFVLDLKGILFD
jgi:hypothetical protein